MQLKQFLEQIQNDASFLETQSVVPFIYSDDNFPIIFSARLSLFLKEKNICLESLDVSELELSHIFSRLETSFLGMRMVYWLRGIENKDKKARQQLMSYLSEYHGPHTILFMSNKDDREYYSTKKNVVELPSSVTSESLASLLTMFSKKINPVSSKYISGLLSKHDAITLDQMCMLISYIQVVGKLEDFNKVVDRVIESEHSLFTLAQHFFAKNSTDFYKLWNSLGPIYPITFWCVYWSEQLWRAYYAHYYVARGQLTQAKTISARLPFSFLQKDWKKVSLDELKNAHQWIYDLDRAYKNNLETEIGIDLFFNKFFLNEF